MIALGGYPRFHTGQDNALPVMPGPDSAATGGLLGVPLELPVRLAPDVASPAVASLAPATGHAALVSGWLTTGLSSAGHALLVFAVVMALGSAGKDTLGEAALDVEIIVEAASAAAAPASAIEPKLIVELPPPLPAPVIEPETPVEIASAPISARIDTPAPRPPDAVFEPPPKAEAPAELTIPKSAPQPPAPQPPSKHPPQKKQQASRQPASRKIARLMARKTEPGAGQAPRAIAPPRGDNAASIDAFRAAVAARVARNKPDGGAADRAQGVVVVAFSIGNSGAASAIRIASSSGHGVLDQAALSAVRRASPFPAPPPGAPRNFTVPMRFTSR